MSPPALPAELTDVIIDHLHADRDALAACALVCRAWRDAAQHHLLATIFCGRGALRRLLMQVEARDDAPRVAGTSRVEDDTGVSDAFAPRVREVWVIGPRLGFTALFDVGTMARLLAALPNLHTLHLARVSLVLFEATQAIGARVAEEPQARYTLRRLDLQVVHQADTRRLTAMLRLCAEVQELTLGCVFETEHGDYDVEDANDRTRCQSLVVDGRYSVSFEVRRALRLDVLKTFEVKFPLPTHIPSVLEMLTEAAGSLESLTLHLYPRNPTHAWAFLSRIPWAALSHLSLVFEIENGREALHLASIARLLSYLPQTISDVELRLYDWQQTIKTVQALEWDELETQLLRFPGLRLFTVSLTEGRPGIEECFLEMAKKGMPTLVARGLLAAGHAQT